MLRLSEDKPDIVLLDIALTSLDGLETCRRLRADESFQDVYVIFITALNDAQTRDACYEAGGDDLLIKPTGTVEIRSKVDKALENQRLVTDLRNEVAQTMDTLMTTIVTSGEYGAIMNFFRYSHACRSMAELAEMMLKVLDEFQLVGTVQLRANGKVLTMNSQRRSSPLEQEMLYAMSLGNDHIVDYGNRTTFCYPNVALLIKAMPIDDPDTYGRMKDNLALMTEGAEFRLKALSAEMNVLDREAALLSSLEQMSSVLSSANHEFRRGQSEMVDIFRELTERIEWTISTYGLMEDQENSILKVIRDVEHRATALYDSGLELEGRLASVLDTLRGNVSAPRAD